MKTMQEALSDLASMGSVLTAALQIKCSAQLRFTQSYTEMWRAIEQLCFCSPTISRLVTWPPGMASGEGTKVATRALHLLERYAH